MAQRPPGAGAPPVASLASAPTAKKSGPDPKVLFGIGAAVVVLIGVVVAAVILTMNTKTGEDSVTHKPAEASGTSAPATSPSSSQASSVLTSSPTPTSPNSKRRLKANTSSSR
jgi:hypothetical protein